MPLHGKFDDGQGTPGVDQHAARIKSLALKQDNERATGDHIKNQEDAFEEKQIAGCDEITQEKDRLRPRRVDRRRGAKTAIEKEHRVDQRMQRGSHRPVHVGAEAG